MEESFVCETCDNLVEMSESTQENKEEFLKQLEQIKKDNKLSVIEIGAEWCPRCKQLKDIFDSIKTNYEKDVNFIVFDYEKNQEEINKEFDVMSLPTVVLMKNGQSVYRFDTIQSKKKIIEIISKYR